MNMTVRSDAFDEQAVIPVRYTGDAEDVSPPLSWSGVPEGTKELALIMDDPDAPSAEPWVHWVIYKLPASTHALVEGVPADARLAEPAGALQGKNSWDTVGYRGPAPPRGHGVHHYHFKAYALDTVLDLSAGVTKQQLVAAMAGHILGSAELIGTYSR